MSTVLDGWVPRHRISVDEYHRMVEVGVLSVDMRVELIEGEIVDMAPIGSRHAAVVDFLNRALNRAVADRAIVAVQRPIQLALRSQPQPDLAVLRPREDFFSSVHPQAADVLLLIEVSDTTLRYDREIKLPLYARHLIPEVWLIDLQAKKLHSYRQSDGTGYASTTMVRSSTLELAALRDVSVDIADLTKLL